MTGFWIIPKWLLLLVTLGLDDKSLRERDREFQVVSVKSKNNSLTGVQEWTITPSSRWRMCQSGQEGVWINWSCNTTEMSGCARVALPDLFSTTDSTHISLIQNTKRHLTRWNTSCWFRMDLDTNEGHKFICYVCIVFTSAIKTLSRAVAAFGEKAIVDLGLRLSEKLPIACWICDNYPISALWDRPLSSLTLKVSQLNWLDGHHKGDKRFNSL